MRERRSVNVALAVVAALAALVASAFQEIPRQSANELGVTRSRPFTAGAVFINGKYIEPPYVVERWGTGIRINSQQVTGEVIDWNDFLKTQAGVKVTKTEAAPPPAETAPAPVAVPADSPDESSLDDLFDDNPKPKKSKSGFQASSAGTVSPVAPRPTTTYSLDGEFVPNDATKRMLERINSTRTEIDRILRAGGFICFGNNYSRVAGDGRTLLKMLESLPELMQKSYDVQEFCAGVRSARLVYLNEILCSDLFANRTDYRKLQELRTNLRKEQQMRQMLDDIKTPLF